MSVQQCMVHGLRCVGDLRRRDLLKDPRYGNLKVGFTVSVAGRLTTVLSVPLLSMAEGVCGRAAPALCSAVHLS